MARLARRLHFVVAYPSLGHRPGAGTSSKHTRCPRRGLGPGGCRQTKGEFAMLTRCLPVNLPSASYDSPIDRLFNEMLSGLGGELAVPFQGVKAFPALNIWHDEHNVFVEAELPGFSMEQVDISLAGRELTLQARRETDSTVKGAEFIRRERASGTFGRTIRLPVNVDAQQVTAKLSDGVLMVTLPKAPEARSRKIAVNAG